MSDRRTPTALEARHIALFRRLIEEGFSQGHLAVVDEVVAPRCVEHQPGIEPGPDGLKRAIRFLHTAFPDFSLSVEDLTADGDMVWGRLRGCGTHLGPLGPVPPTGRAMAIDVLDVCRFDDGKIVEHWGVPDRFAQLEQLGLLPRP